MRDLQLTAVYNKVEEGGFVAQIEELPWVITQGETMNEAEENLYDALTTFLKPAQSDEHHITTTISTVKIPFISLHRQAWKKETS